MFMLQFPGIVSLMAEKFSTPQAGQKQVFFRMLLCLPNAVILLFITMRWTSTIDDLAPSFPVIHLCKMIHRFRSLLLLYYYIMFTSYGPIYLII